MKKIFLAAVFVTSGCVLFAQDSSRTNNGTQRNDTTTGQWNNNTGNSQMNNSTNSSMNTNSMSNNQSYNSTSTSDYSAYGIPNYVQQNFQTAHPNTNLMWDRPSADWYHGYYMDNGRYTNVYYSTDPYYNSGYYPERVTGYTVSLPVLQTYVPDNVISTATNMYKQNLYDIVAVKGNNHQNLYQVRLIDNGQIRTMWIDSAGTSTADIYRTEQNMNTEMQTTNSNTINSTQSNAAMDHSKSEISHSNNEIHHSENDMYHKKVSHKNVKTKTKKVTSDGRKIITKTKNGKTRTWTENNNNNNDQQ